MTNDELIGCLKEGPIEKNDKSIHGWGVGRGVHGFGGKWENLGGAKEICHSIRELANMAFFHFAVQDPWSAVINRRGSASDVSST